MIPKIIINLFKNLYIHEEGKIFTEYMNIFFDMNEKYRTENRISKCDEKKPAKINTMDTYICITTLC